MSVTAILHERGSSQLRSTSGGWKPLVGLLEQKLRGSGVMSKLVEAVQRCDVDAMKEAIASGADLNEMDDGMTPLLWAILGGHFDAIKLLLESGADPNVRPNPAAADREAHPF
jgi:hypothetical protein